MNDRTKLVRTNAPRRELNKRIALRRLIHASIRLILAGEDPLAVQLMLQSADKVQRDLLRIRRLDDLFAFDAVVSQEHRNEFFSIYREVANFLKHADEDAEQTISTYQLVLLNDILTIASIVRYHQLYDHTSRHMRLFLSYAVAAHPTFLDWAKFGNDFANILSLIHAESGLVTRAEMLASINASLSTEISLRAEREADVEEATEFGRRTLPLRIEE